jgi:hypothetical protein
MAEENPTYERGLYKEKLMLCYLNSQPCTIHTYETLGKTKFPVLLSMKEEDRETLFKNIKIWSV